MADDSIVVQLQRDALSSEIPVTDLLRKALVIARKLRISDFEAWTRAELNGYSQDENDIPAYRYVRGEVRANNPAQGWIPVMFAQREIGAKYRRRPTNQSIPELESLLSKADGFLAMPFPDEVAKAICSNSPLTFPVALHVDRSALVGIVSRVRDTVLNWALQLEEDGIRGDGLSFSQEEKRSADSRTYNINNFYGDSHHAQIAQGTDRSVQSSTVTTANLKELVHELQQAVTQDLGIPQDDLAILNSDIATLDAQAASPSPKRAVIRETLQSVRRILEGAAASQTAAVLAQIAAYF